MKNDNSKLLVGLVVLVAVISLISMSVSIGNQVNEDELSDKITADVISQIPEQEVQEINTDEIASSVATLISATEAEVPQESELTDNEKLNDVWEKVFAENITELKDKAIDVAVEELEKDDYEVLEDLLKETVEGFDEIVNVSGEDFEASIVELGLGEDEDKSATVEFELEVEYTLKEGLTDSEYKKVIFVTADVSFEEGDFDDEEVEFTFE